MKNIILNNKPFFKFLLVFFSVYGLLFLGYQKYLKSFDAYENQTDSFTHLVAKQSSKTIKLMGYTSKIYENPNEPSYFLKINNAFTVRVVEGCNAMSLMILFLAFIIAFKGSWQKVLFFVLFGLLIIHVLNIIRIAVITIALYHYPHLEHLLHGIIFPLIIYGVVFMLWVVWVTKFSVYAKK